MRRRLAPFTAIAEYGAKTTDVYNSQLTGRRKNRLITGVCNAANSIAEENTNSRVRGDSDD
jgi:hypothetical protein